MTATVLLATAVPATLRDELNRRYRLLEPGHGNFEEKVASLSQEDAASVSVIVALSSARLTSGGLAMLPALRLVCFQGVGYDGIDTVAAAAAGIAVTHNPGANAAAVADMAMGLMIASVRRFPDAQRYLHDGRWATAQGPYPPMRGLTGRKVGIHGLGTIGRLVARRAAAFDMEIGYCGRQVQPDVPYPYFSHLLALAQWCDVLVICVPAQAATRHAVNAEILKALGPQGHLVNISRGSTVDESALMQALGTGVIAGAGLDVFENEPNISPKWFELDNVVLTPHVAGSTLEASRQQQAGILRSIEAHLKGLSLISRIPGSRSA